MSNIENNHSMKNSAQEAFNLAAADEDVSDQLINKAGPRAIANLFSFVITGDEDGMIVAMRAVNPEASFSNDSLVNKVMPVGFTGYDEMLWEVESGVSLKEAAASLYKTGFQFSEVRQNDAQDDFTAQIKQAITMVSVKKNQNTRDNI